MTIEEFLSRCEFGFELRDDGYYKPVIKYDERSWFGKYEEFRTSVNGFISFLNKTLDVYITYIDFTKFSFAYMSLTPDCNKFITHQCDCRCDDKYNKWYVDHKYSEISYFYEHKDTGSWVKDVHNITQYDKYIKYVNFQKHYSPDEFKQLLIEKVHEYIKENKDRIKNKKRFKNEGNVFIRCG